MYKNLKSIETLTISEFIERMSELPPKKIRQRKGNWLKLIQVERLTCPATGKIVNYCSLDQHKRNKTFHYNFYSEDGFMFTIDHIQPISKGGSKTSIKNIQPMIDTVNWEKSNQTHLGY